MMPYMEDTHPAHHIRSAIDDALRTLSIPVSPYVVEYPADVTHGDLASSVALVHAKVSGHPPRVLAQSLVDILQHTIPHVDRIDIAGPGFLNFTLSRAYMQGMVAHACASQGEWGAHTTLRGSTVLFEYTSPNLFKPLHIGNLVGNIIGESLSRLMENAGATVHRINYPSDIGLTVAKGVWGIQHTGGNPDNIQDLGRAYVAGHQAYEAGHEDKDAIVDINRALYAGTDEALMDIRARGIATSLARLSDLCRLLGTEFDTVIFESEAGPIGTEIVKEGIKKHIFVLSDGAVVYPGEKVGLHTRVFLNAQGLPTYEAKDLGNFQKKRAAYPDWTHSVVVTGNEQTEYFKVMFEVMKELFPEARERTMMHIPTGFLTLTTGKMSSRLGNVLTGESLIESLREEALDKATHTRASDVEALADMIAVSALKYQILRQKVGGDILFDKAQALSFEGDSGPYVQYTHARAASIGRLAKERGIMAHTDLAPTVPYILERYLYRFPSVTLRAVTEHSPHYLTTYMIELASLFNAFYAQERILEAGDVHAPYKVALTLAVQHTLARGLALLGMSAPEEM